MERGKYRRGVFVVTYIKTKKGIKYLLLKRKLHWKGWEFPKGGLEKGENLIKGVKREIKEETGQRAFNIKSYKEKGKYNYDKRYNDRKGFIGQAYVLFSAEIKNEKVKVDKKEHSKYIWLNYDKALKKLKWPNQRKSLRIVNASLNF